MNNLETTKMETSHLETKLRKARAALIGAHPFFAVAALRFDMAADPTVKTTATDGLSLRYDPAFVDAATVPELMGVWGQAVCKTVSLHHTRRRGRDLSRWRRASTLVANLIVADSGMTLPKGELVDTSFRDLSVEEVYRRLTDDDGGSGTLPGGTDQGLDGAGSNAICDAPGKDGQAATQTEIEQTELEAQALALQSAAAAKAQGKLPASMARLAAAARHPKADWRTLLRRFFQAQTAKEDYRWSPPSRRFAWQGLYLPSVRSEAMGPVIVAVDTSGSIGQAELDQFGAEINAIFEDVRPELVALVYCDAAVQGTEEYRADDFPIKLAMQGGGGTDFGPVFAWAQERFLDEGQTPAALVYLTDLCGSMPDDAPPYPVLWANTYPAMAKNAKWGEVVDIR